MIKFSVVILYVIPKNLHYLTTYALISKLLFLFCSEDMKYLANISGQVSRETRQAPKSDLPSFNLASKNKIWISETIIKSSVSLKQICTDSIFFFSPATQAWLHTYVLKTYCISAGIFGVDHSSPILYHKLQSWWIRLRTIFKINPVACKFLFDNLNYF